MQIIAHDKLHIICLFCAFGEIMADFWIKMEKGTPDKPEILEMAEILSIDDPDSVTGKMVRVWSWFDSNSETGNAPRVTKTLIDRLTGVIGFTDALIAVGWLETTERGFSVPKFERHLGKGAKKRSSDAERKRQYRNSQNKTEQSTAIDNSTTPSPSVEAAFNHFWQNMRLTKSNEIKSQTEFANAAKSESDPMRFAERLIADTKKRLANNQPSFNLMHPNNYIRDLRYNDAYTIGIQNGRSSVDTAQDIKQRCDNGDAKQKALTESINERNTLANTEAAKAGAAKFIGKFNKKGANSE